MAFYLQSLANVFLFSNTLVFKINSNSSEMLRSPFFLSLIYPLHQQGYPLVCGHSSSELFHMDATITLIWATDNGCWVIAKASSLVCGLPALKALVYPPLASESQENTINTSLLCPRLPSSSKVSLKFYPPLVLSPGFCSLFHWSPNWFPVKLLSFLGPSLTRSDLRGEVFISGLQLRETESHTVRKAWCRSVKQLSYCIYNQE